MTALSGVPPVWLLGLCLFPFGAYFAITVLTVPQLLVANGVPEPQIANLTAIGVIPTFASFLCSPILDWRFTRRAYATVLAVLSTAAMIGVLASIRELTQLAVFTFCGAAAITLYAAAVGGWFGTIVAPSDKARLGAWFTVGNVAGGGVTATIAITVLRHLPFGLAAALLGSLLLGPLLLFPFISTPAPDQRLAAVSFQHFFRDVLAVLRRPSVVWTLVLFALPAASFALTNFLPALGHDFNASEQAVGLITGSGVTVAGITGSLIVPRLVSRIAPRVLYVVIATIGALLTLSLTAMPRTPITFAVAVLGENVFQSAAFAVEFTIILTIIGEANPFAATQYGLLTAAPNLPITYMQAVDGAAYGFGGLTGAFVADATIGLTACAIGVLLFSRIAPESEI